MSYLLALLSALCSGFTTVLEATAARRSTEVHKLDARLLLRLATQVPFVAAMALSAIGLVAAALALRELPLFTAQAVFASSVGFAAIIAAVTHGEHLTAEVRFGVGTIVVGLVLLGLASEDQPVPETSTAFRFGVLAAVLASLALTAWVARRPGRSGLDTGALGVCAGLLYGFGTLGLRLIETFQPSELLRDPAAWATFVGGSTAVLTISIALQRGSVALSAGACTVTETMVPTILGLLLLGERPRPGWSAVAVLGFTLAVGGAIALCRDVDVLDAEPAP